MKIKHLLLSFLFIVGLLSCKKSRENHWQAINPEFANYISAFTGGIISTQKDIQIVLLNEIKLLPNEKNELPSDLLSFSPNIDGKLVMKDKLTLAFIPTQALPQDAFYTATLNLQKIQSQVPDSLAKFSFEFKTIKQDYDLAIKGLENVSAKDTNVYKLNGSIFTADNADAESIEKLLSVKNQSDITWQHLPNQHEHRFSINNIARENEPSALNLKLDGRAINTEKNLDTTIAVPSKNNFGITQIKAFSYPEQYISVYFSEPVQSMDFQGYFLIKNQIMKFKSVVVNANEIKIYPNDRIDGNSEFTVNQGINSIYGNTLTRSQIQNLPMNSLAPAVEMVGNGNIIPQNEGLFLPFKAVGLKSVKVEITKIFEQNVHQFFQFNQLDGDNSLKLVGRKILTKIVPIGLSKDFSANNMKVYQLELSKLIAPEQGAIYNVKITFTKEMAVNVCNEKVINSTDLTLLERQSDNWDEDTNIDDYYNDGYGDYSDDYDYSQRDNPCHNSYYNSSRFVSRNVLASNIGLIAKIGNDRKAYLSVSDILDVKAMAGVSIKAFDLQRQLVGEGSTDSDGMVSFDLKRKPFLFIAQKENQRGYLRVDDGSSLSLSNFEVSGATYKKGINGFIYGERGVWRPGDSLFLSFTYKDALHTLPKDQPAILELYNPDGQIVQKQLCTNHLNQFYSFKASTTPEARTGNYTAKVLFAGLTFEKTIKIETIKPNRLKINTVFASEVLTSESQTFKIQSSWLSGITASKLKAKVDASVTSIKTEFKGYPNYVFDDPSKKIETSDNTIFEGFLSDNGEATIQNKLASNLNAPGMLSVGIHTKVFEAGGEFSTSYIKKNLAPYTGFVGLRLPESAERLETDKDNVIELVTVDTNGKPRNASKLEIKVYKLNQSAWYNTDEANVAHYVSGDYQSLAVTDQVATSSGKATFKFKIGREEWGKYFISILDTETGHSTGQATWIDWPEWRSRGGISNESAAIIAINSDKESYKVGDKAFITIPSSNIGRALISYENGSGVIKQEWINTQAGQTQFSVKLSPEMAPNVFVNVSMIQPHANTVNDLPIRMYGILPLIVENPDSRISPKITAPVAIKPNTNYDLTVSEQNAKDMTYTLAVVDEGLLDITNFTTPAIYDHFNQKQSLGVKTWDVYNYVLGAFGGKIESVFTIGGDMSMRASNKEKISRFKPVVTFIGPFSLSGGHSKTHTLKMENYIGAVKVMVVAGNEAAFGASEQSIKVKQPLMTLSTLPRTLTPGDEIVLPIDVFAMENNIKNVKINVVTNDKVTVLNASSQNLSFAKTGDQLAYFSLKVPNKLGKATIEIMASAGGNKSIEKLEIEVRAPNPPVTTVVSKELTNGQVFAFQASAMGITGTNENVLEISTLPNFNLDKRLKYLIHYPYGCVEQTTSSVFPQLYLGAISDLSEEMKKRVQVNVSAGLARLKTFQVPGNGLSYWPNEGSSDEWGTNYALHFILEAEKQGYTLPVGLKEPLVQYQEKMAKNWNYYNAKVEEQNQLQTYRLFTLALAQKADMGLLNRLKEIPLDQASNARLAAAYQLVGRDSQAQKMVININNSPKKYTYNHTTYGSDLRDEAMLLETLTLLNQRAKATLLLKKIASSLATDEWYSTQTTAYSLLAISQYLKQYSKGSGYISADILVNGKVQKVQANSYIYTVKLPTANAKIELKNTGKSVLFCDFSQTGVPISENLSAINRNLNVSVLYQDTKGNTLDPTAIKQGTDFKAIVNISNPGTYSNYQNVALKQLFPSGWEIINSRVFDGTIGQNAGIRYQDFRDDRVYSFFDLPKNKSISVTVMLNATYKGNYYLPAIVSEGMYDKNIYNLVSGKRVRVL